MKPKHWDSAARYRRTERRRSTAMFIIGTLFTITGVFIWFTDSLWLGLTSIVFGLAVVLGGVLSWSQAHGSDGSLKVAVIGCLLFVVLSALMIIGAVVSPEDFDGQRGPLYAVIAGSLGLAFFGPGLIVLIVKLVQRSRADQTRPGKAGGDEIL
ncbi:hypothetical protein [Yaniella halotolerans]|uniref:hypothetical protein n=1 Tax=Yaniella halotolerans TaxID=225453 RepID=UPI0012EBA45F|nr:hypothetical protein [Yaniella halotolerans]